MPTEDFQDCLEGPQAEDLTEVFDEKLVIEDSAEEIIELVGKSKRFMPHFHVPLQSGNDKQLREMRRRYKRSLYADRVEWIKKHLPHACVGCDVIVGFPGETEGILWRPTPLLVPCPSRICMSLRTQNEPTRWQQVCKE